MPTLHVANTTKQPHDFIYQILGEPHRPRKQTIEPGAQIMVYKKDLTTDEIAHIIEQHSRYGLRATNEIPRTKAFIGLCYSIDKPVDVEKFMVVEEQNNTALVQRNLEIQKTAAVAIDANLRGQTDGLTQLSTEVVEQAKPGATPAEGELYQQTIEVASGPDGAPAPRGRAANRRR